MILRSLITVCAAALLLGACAQPQPPAPPPPPPPAQATSFMVFFDWDRSDLSGQARNTIQQAANAYKTTGSARVTAFFALLALLAAPLLRRRGGAIVR